MLKTLFGHYPKLHGESMHTNLSTAIYLKWIWKLDTLAERERERGRKNLAWDEIIS